MNLIKSLSIFNLFCLNFICFAMQRQMMLSMETMPLVLLDIKQISPDASEQEYDELYQKIREQGETLDCIVKYRRAKRQLKLEALKETEFLSMSDAEWDEQIEKRVQEIKKSLEKPNVTSDKLIVSDKNIPKNIIESIKKIYTQKNLHVPLTITLVDDSQRCTAAMRLNDAQDCYIFPLHPGHFDIWSDFTPLHEFTHATEGDIIYGNVITKITRELFKQKNKITNLNLKIDKYTLIACSYARAREKVADQIPAASGTLKESEITILDLKILQQIEKKDRESYRLKYNKEYVELRPIHPPIDKRVKWAQKIYNLKKAEQRLLRKK